MKKRILSAILACVCLLGIIGSASAVEPRGALVPTTTISGSTTYVGDDGRDGYAFTTKAGDGEYLRVWYRNFAKPDAKVTLCDENGNAVQLTPVSKSEGAKYPMEVGERSNQWVVFRVSNTAAKSFRVNIAANGDIYGELAVAQYVTLP